MADPIAETPAVGEVDDLQYKYAVPVDENNKVSLPFSPADSIPAARFRWLQAFNCDACPAPCASELALFACESLRPAHVAFACLCIFWTLAVDRAAHL